MNGARHLTAELRQPHLRAVLLFDIASLAVLDEQTLSRGAIPGKKLQRALMPVSDVGHIDQNPANGLDLAWRKRRRGGFKQIGENSLPLSGYRAIRWLSRQGECTRRRP